MSTHVSLRGIAARTISHSLGDRRGRKRSGGGFYCHFKTNDWSPSWGLAQHRVAPVPKCPSSSLQVSFHHRVNLRHSDVRRKEKHYCERNFEPLACVPPVIIPSFPKTHACGSLRESLLSLLSLAFSLALRGSSHSTRTWITPIRLGGWEYPLASTHLLPHGAAPTDRSDGDDGEDNAPRGSVRWDAYSACFPPTHTYAFAPHPSRMSPPRLQTPHPRTRAASSVGTR